MRATVSSTAFTSFGSSSLKKALAISTYSVMMTGAGDLTILAFKAGADDFIQKPFGRGELLAVLDQLSIQAANV